MSEKEFNPIVTARKIEQSYQEYISTTIHFENKELQSQLEEILSEPGFLAKGPFLEAAPPYVKAKSVRELVEEGVLCKSMLSLGGGDPKLFDPDRPLYVHQEKAIRKAHDGRNYAVVTGTGSGKTECFLLPILNDILSEFEEKGPSSGVRALILYPMNALANDQIKRLRELLKGTDITFGRYTGDTAESYKNALENWNEENSSTKLPNEIISREDIRKEPPNILLTNYSMLEYLLFRPQDAPLFGSVFGANWRHIAIDEAHIYSGSLGTEIAFLIRRLKARIEIEAGKRPELHCYATSATIGSEEDMPKVAQFAQDLFGEPFESEGDEIDVITSERNDPIADLDPTPWGKLDLSCWSEIRQAISDHEDIDVEDLLKALEKGGAPSSLLREFDREDPLMGLGKILLGETSTAALVRRCQTLLDLTDVSAIEEIGIDGLEGNSKGVSTLSAMVEVLSAAQRSEDVPILSSRYHSFLRAPQGIYINLASKKLTPYKTVSEPYDDKHSVPVYEASVCRHCGQAYILGTNEPDESGNTRWLNPRHAGTDADDEFLPSVYYRLLGEETEADNDEEVIWLCPICGCLHNEKEGATHRFNHEEVEPVPISVNKNEELRSDETMGKCRHCGYKSNIAIQPMRVSPEAAGSVVCYDLVRDLPPFESDEERNWWEDEDKAKGGSVICFSDKRQDAAFFAPSFERTYNNITRRQIIQEAVEELDDGYGATPDAIINWIASQANKKYPGLLSGDKRQQAEAWVIDELAADDSRNSLDGLGVVRIEPTELIKFFEGPKCSKRIERLVCELNEDGIPWLTTEDYKLFLSVSLDTLRENGAIHVKPGIDVLRNNYNKRGNAVILDSTTVADDKDTIQFAGLTSNPENKRSLFIRKYAETVYGETVSREDARTILVSLFGILNDIKRKFYNEPFGDDSARFILDKQIWTFYKHSDDDVIYRCDRCGCESHLDTKGVCLTHKCHGHMVPMTFKEALDKDRFYKEKYQEEGLPIKIEEHTAQLSNKKARKVQSEFIKGKVNVLSCTTTFELGVDVGELRTVFLRNVPPSAANYKQRAGRVGRRAGKPGYAITFARMRPHDMAFFGNPESIIEGDTCVPACYLTNRDIALRHVFATAISSYLRTLPLEDGTDKAHIYNLLFDLSSERPEGIAALSRYLQGEPELLGKELLSVFPEDMDANKMLDIDGWGWVKDLLGEPDDETGFEGGRLFKIHEMKHEDYQRIDDAIARCEAEREFTKAGVLQKTQGALENEKTINILAENGVLPKYGFPTDLVELHLPEVDRAVEENTLTLTRGLRQAISEYAPGSEIVAGKTVWKSVGIRTRRSSRLTERRYGVCDECGTFMWPIDDLTETDTCPVCHKQVTLKSKMLVPSFGFVAKASKKEAGVRKPRTKGYTQIEFSQRWPNETIENEPLRLPGGTVRSRYASNGQLCALNEGYGSGGFSVCKRCGAAGTKAKDIPHWESCKKSDGSPVVEHYQALGTAFTSDVLELSFDLDRPLDMEKNSWISVTWALFTAGAKMLDIPETELGGTTYPTGPASFSMMIYDNVPGGAGHSKRLANNLEELIRAAYKVVDGHCGCGDDTCCYGCIANYYNQKQQAELSRGDAKAILGELLFSESEETEIANEPSSPATKATKSSQSAQRAPRQSSEGSIALTPAESGPSFRSMSFADACGGESEDDQWNDLIRKLCLVNEESPLPIPDRDVNLIASDGSDLYASLAWKDRQIALLNEEDSEDFCDSLGENWQAKTDWTLFSVRNCTAPEIIEALRSK